MAEIGKDINKAKQLLEAGELVAIPTETVYGLAGNALDAAAVAKIFEVKQRPQFDPLIVHVPDQVVAHQYVKKIPETAAQLMQRYWPGPLTILLERKDNIPDLVTAGLDRVALRCPNHDLALALLRAIDFPLAAPSANPFGYVSPTTADHVNEQLGEKIAYILDGGSATVGIESTIVGFENEKPIVYRAGGLNFEAIEAITGPVQWQLSSSNPKAPGQLKSHYAPRKKVVLGKFEELLQLYPAHDSALLTFNQDFNSPYQFILSESGSLEEAARNLFTALRTLDKLPVERILTSFVPDHGLGIAINDRLKRAAAE